MAVVEGNSAVCDHEHNYVRKERRKVRREVASLDWLILHDSSMQAALPLWEVTTKQPGSCDCPHCQILQQTWRRVQEGTQYSNMVANTS